MLSTETGPTDHALGAQVRAARTAKRVSLRRLAAALDLSPATLSQIENGRTRLSVSRLARIADALEVPVTQILDTVAGASAVTGPESAPAADPPFLPLTPGPTADWRSYQRLSFDPVLQAALDEFVAVGYHGATVRGIAARAELSVSGIYHYYTSKQQMLARILELTMSELLQRAQLARAEGRDAVERFSLLVEHLALFHTHRRELGFVGASEMRSLDPENRHGIAELRTTQQRMVEHEVDDAVRQGRFRPDHPHEAARAIVTMCTALSTWWRPDGPSSPEDVARQYVGLALDMMRARPMA